MSIDLNFWKYREGVYLDNEAVYQAACCEMEAVEGLEALPLEDILGEIEAAFPEWTAPDPTSRQRGGGSFEILALPQAIRFDCYSMEQADMKRFSTLMSRFGCPLYDPQQGVRFDNMAVFLIDEAGGCRAEAEETLSRLLPRFELAVQTVTWDAYTRLSKDLKQIHCSAVIHRAKTRTSVTSFLRFGSGWANRSCHCKTALLADEGESRRILGELLERSIKQVVGDFLERTRYQ